MSNDNMNPIFDTKNDIRCFETYQTKGELKGWSKICKETKRKVRGSSDSMNIKDFVSYNKIQRFDIECEEKYEPNKTTLKLIR